MLHSAVDRSTCFGSAALHYDAAPSGLCPSPLRFPFDKLILAGTCLDERYERNDARYSPRNLEFVLIIEMVRLWRTFDWDFDFVFVFRSSFKDDPGKVLLENPIHRMFDCAVPFKHLCRNRGALSKSLSTSDAKRLCFPTSCRLPSVEGHLTVVPKKESFLQKKELCWCSLEAVVI